ncbi:non-ribosomal peptide synthetase [Streptomyces antimicrobicus]|uniref:Non-ribosomal peptide synthetase n=1 Tax=Streptomyces antimicrobicus TaxID=2883108 RepID=A0ABS8BA98_9ACTN|nr:non-ribosomal peptide synthetase [Streptomyces antimicrobicus]MCB5181541.1 non-ribosomal peptide synthetase [Streptomyces antimicrobicus]
MRPTTPPSTLSDLLLAAAEQYPSSGLRHCRGAAHLGHQDESHPELLGRARRILTGLRARGLRPQDKIVIVLERSQEFLPTFWAAVLGGFVPCPVAPPAGDPVSWAERLRHVGALLDGPLLVTTAALAERLPAGAGVPAVAVLEELDGPEAAELHRAAPEDTAVLMLTSGSSGAAKAAMLSHAALLASMAAKNGHHRLSAADTSLNWVSFDHVAALLECHLLPLSTGSRQVHVPASAVLGDPLEFLRLIDRHGVTMTFTPNFLLGQINAAAGRLAATGERLDLRRLRHVVSGGEAVVVATGETFLRTLAPYGLAPDALWPAFGMTETCAGSVYARGTFPGADGDAEFAHLGTPVEGLRMRIVDEAGRELPEGRAGELQLRGPMLTSGYLNDPRATAEAFTADGWFRSGDLGRIDEGRLTLVGRSKDSVVVNGVSYFSHDVETVLGRLEGVTPARVAAFPTRPAGSDTEQLVIAFAPDLPAGDDAALHRVVSAVRSTVVMHWGFRPALVLPLPAEAFPCTSLGKIQRSLMRRRLESGAYDAERRAAQELRVRMLGGHTAPEGPVERVIAEVYAELFGADPASISATASFFDLGGTSLDILRLRGKVAQRLGVAGLEVVTVLTAPTVRDLAARLAGRTRDLAGGPAADPAGGRAAYAATGPAGYAATASAGYAATGPAGYAATGPAGYAATGPAAYEPLVPLQTGGAKTPLFCVHPGVGEVLVFVGLATYFAGDRPFYALRARGFNEGEKPFVSFEEMVDTYVDAIRSRQPHGPYALAGYSYGAAVAFEIAKVLEAEGERVDFVGSFNLPPHIKYRMEELDFTETAAHLAAFLDLVDKEQAAALPALLRGRPREEQVAHLVSLAPPQRLAELDLDEAKFAAWAEVADALTDLGRGYEPTGTVRSMSVFHAEPLRGTREDWLANELRRWDEHTTGPNRYLEVPGSHHTLMGPRHVAAFQEILRRELDDRLAEADAVAAARR